MKTQKIKMKHTAGPWIAKTYSRVRSSDLVRIETETDLICEIHNLFRGYDGDLIQNGENEKQANARLIASAPELLAALQACFESGQLTPLTPNVLRQARLAISKATGEEMV